MSGYEGFAAGKLVDVIKGAGASGSFMTTSGVHDAPVGCILALCGVIRHLAYARTDVLDKRGGDFNSP